MKSIYKNVLHLPATLTVIAIISLVISAGCFEKSSRPASSGALKALTGAIIGGKRVAIDQFSSTVYLHMTNGATDSCSGALVDHSTVLTAAHCLTDLIDKYNSENSLDKIMVMVGNGVLWEKNHYFKVSKIAIHPEYKLKRRAEYAQEMTISERSERDFAYLELDRPVPDDLVTLIPPITTEEVKQHVRVGKEIILAGFGKTGESSFGFKKMVKGVIRKYDRKTGLVQHVGVGDERGGICQGDSGGPAFIQLPDGSLRLLAVTSYLSGVCGDKETDYRGNSHFANLGMDFIKMDRLKSQGDNHLSLAAPSTSDQLRRKAYQFYQKALDLLPVNDELVIWYGALVREFDALDSELNEDVLAREYTLKMYKSLFKKEFSKALEYYPKSSEFKRAGRMERKLFQGHLLFKLKKIRESFLFIEEFLYGDNDDIARIEFVSHPFIAFTVFYNNDLELAKDIAQKILDDDPFNPEINALMMYIAIIEGWDDDQIDRFMEKGVMAHFSPYAISLAPLTEALQSFAPEKAVKFQELTRKKQIRIYWNDLKALITSNLYHLVPENIVAIEKADPYNYKIYYYKAQYLLRIRKYQEAFFAILVGLKKRPHDADLWNILGVVFRYKAFFQSNENNLNLSMNGHDAAFAFARAILLRPDHPEASANYANLLMDKGDLVKAEKVISAKISIAPNLIDYKIRVLIYLKQSKYKAALEDLKRYMELHPADADMYSELGQLYEILGNSKAARKVDRDLKMRSKRP